MSAATTGSAATAQQILAIRLGVQIILPVPATSGPLPQLLLALLPRLHHARAPLLALPPLHLRLTHPVPNVPAPAITTSAPTMDSGATVRPILATWPGAPTSHSVPARGSSALLLQQCPRPLQTLRVRRMSLP